MTSAEALNILSTPHFDFYCIAKRDFDWQAFPGKTLASWQTIAKVCHDG